MRGILHRAFSVLIFDNRNRLLIQKRSDDKITFPGYWANSCCSHPLFDYGELESGIVEGVAKAAIRKMPQELGIDTSNMKPSDFNLIGRFEYKAKAESGWVEHEIDYVIATHFKVDLNLNSNEVSEIKWLSKEDLTIFCNENPEIIAPWFLAIINLYLKDWWPNDSKDYLKYDLQIINKGGINLSLPESVLSSLKEHSPIIEKIIIDTLSTSNQEKLQSAMLYLIESGGKRLRASLPYLVGDLLGESKHSHYEVGAAIEIIHNFTLIHDDIMDDDLVRRGRPSVHVAFDVPTAINARRCNVSDCI